MTYYDSPSLEEFAFGAACDSCFDDSFDELDELLIVGITISDELDELDFFGCFVWAAGGGADDELSEELLFRSSLIFLNLSTKEEEGVAAESGAVFTAVCLRLDVLLAGVSLELLSEELLEELLLLDSCR
ncbi:MAG: hypothetical protein VKL60_22140 [Sphaerospermopsis sp.]|nr:hypothetical protein [Sphaerospermopsis sp.]